MRRSLADPRGLVARSNSNGRTGHLPRWRSLCPAVFLGLLPACATVPPPAFPPAASARPVMVVPPPATNGAIYQAGYEKLNLFEDRRARRVGDTLTVLIEERTNATTQANTSINRKADTKFGVPILAGLPGKSFLGADLSANSSNSLEGKGTSAANNAFTGNLTVTVTEVLANGNLVVAGEKQMALNQGREFVRLSGVVNPIYVSGANTVSSTRIADARLEYRAGGTIDQAQVMGWLARFFLTMLPF